MSIGEWQPIETAPMDGETRVLVYHPGGYHEVCEARLWRSRDEIVYQDPVYDEWNGSGATHWMPLPEPPKICSDTVATPSGIC
jgi:hypothetical protein